MQPLTPDQRHLGLAVGVCAQREMNTTMKNGPKPRFAGYRKILENKAEEVRRSMSAQKAAQVVARLDCPSA